MMKKMAHAGIMVMVVASPFLASGAQEKESRMIFKEVFAPQEGKVAALEKPLRNELCLNGNWEFQPVALPKGHKIGEHPAPELPPPEPGAWEKTPIRIPSPWNVNSFATEEKIQGGDFRCYPSYPAAWESVRMAWMRKVVTIPADWKGKTVILRFDAVAGDVRVLVNGKAAGGQFEIFMPFELDVSSLVKLGEKNEILVGVRQGCLFNQQGKRPYVAGSFWGTHIGGIWQDVFLLALPPTRIADVFIKPFVDQDLLEVEATVRNDSAAAVSVALRGEVKPWINLAGTNVVAAPVPAWKLGESVLTLTSAETVVPAGGEARITLRQNVGKAMKLWSPDEPNLHGLVLAAGIGGRDADRRYTRFGWRQVTITTQSLLLNGARIVLKGDSWHFMGIPQMTRRYAWGWFRMLKDAGANAVRPHAQPYPEFYLDVADEMGIMVLDETAIWASDLCSNMRSPEYWKSCDSHLERLVLRDRNHPSVFGWSVSNEMLGGNDAAGGAKDIEQKCLDQFVTWVSTCRRLDPTRAWISGDGEGDGKGRFPASVIHYGGHVGSGNKPWGVGEATQAYCDTPKGIASVNGDRAYESMEGRMEGLAYQAYGELMGQQRRGASYCSVFNTVWYALKPLELGLRDTTKAPGESDGIFFPSFVEGRPGVQPERLGPYTTTLNPGYDPRLPLYLPWPMFEAIQDAFHLKAESKWAKTPAKTAPAAGGTPAPIWTVGCAGEFQDAQESNLRSMGIPASLVITGAIQVLIVDGAAPPKDTAAVKRLIAKVTAAGGTVLVWGVKKTSLAALNAILPAALDISDRKASSLVPCATNALMRGITASSLYFSESDPWLALDGGLAGPLIEKGEVLLKACDTDWRKWQWQAEYLKTAAVLRSEREAKPSGAAIVSVPNGKGRLICLVDLPPNRQQTAKDLLWAVLRNLGVKTRAESEDQLPGQTVFDVRGELRGAMVCGSFDIKTYEDGFAGEAISGEARANPVKGMKAGSRVWNEAKADGETVFNFRTLNIEGPLDLGVVYLSFWVNSPRPLDNLLAAPNVPKLDLLVAADDGVQAWLNGQEIMKHTDIGQLNRWSYEANALPLKLGWNHFLVKVVQGGGEWKCAAKLRCSSPDYLANLGYATQKPDGAK